MTARRIIFSIIVLFLLYSSYYILTDKWINALGKLSRKNEHVILFISIVLVYIAGSIGLKNCKPPWLNKVWHLFHIVLIPLLLLLGAIDWLTGGLPKGWRHFAQSIGETLVSPILFISIVLMQKAFSSLRSNIASK